MVTLKVFGDESSDETRSRVFAVAGVIGNEVEWQLAMREWLRRTRGMPFHAKQCESEFARHPDPQKHKDNLKLYADLTQILAASYLVGFAVALDLRSHRELFAETLPDLPYYKCLADVVRYAAETAQRFNARPEEPDDVCLEFVFDSRLESNGAAGAVYTAFRNQREWIDGDILGTRIEFQSSEPRLELADLLARESMKELDRKITGARPSMRRSRQVLDETKKFHFIEHDRAYCKKWRAMTDEPESQAMRVGYAKWLYDTGRVQNGRPHDTIVNRYIYFGLTQPD